MGQALTSLLVRHSFGGDHLKVHVHPHFNALHKPPGYREITNEYCKKTREVARELVKAISLSLGLAENYIEEEMELESGSQLLVILTTGRYKSVVHRAVVNNKATRISIGTAHGPPLDTVINPAPELVDSETHPAAYRGITYREYMVLQQSNQLDGKSCLNKLMGRRKKLRDLIGILKDKGSLIKATLSTKLTTSSTHVAVLRATPHSSSPPPEHRVDAVLFFGNCSRPTACACIETIMDRLHNSRNACVAFKCLIVLHNFITRGSFILKDQLSFYPSAGGRNFLNLSRIRYDSDIETLLLSSWIRWYASVLERNLVTSRALGCYFSSSAIKYDKDKFSDSMTSLSNSDLLKEIDLLVGMVEEICRAPDSLHCQKNDLVFEVVRLVSEDYRSTQHQIFFRLSEFGYRLGGLSSGESAELTSSLKRLEECKEKLVALFVNRKRNDDFWDLINQTKMKLVKIKEERERQMVLVRMRKKAEASESTRFRERVVGPSQMLRLPYRSNWLGVDGLHLTVSTATA
ncbi:hypothetical protein F0562_027739 [Nyssa sinensis]|uniref:ENTH domain-containing protein n=1 Tax=Nyssa sinensis TaxID=561372 RepID=A0A5J5BAB6_9ASTE|nr:hypothetical protein F0562_027739 [Nyssa sinensis]